MELPRSLTSRSRWLLICLSLLGMTGCASSDSAPTSGTATLSWDANGGPDLAGYKIYQTMTSGVYGAPIATVTMDFTSYTVTGLETGSTYFFVVTAYNSDGAESSFSNQVGKTI